MAFFSKLKERLFKSSSKLEEGLEAIVEDGRAEESTPSVTPPPPDVPAPARQEAPVAPSPQEVPPPVTEGLAPPQPVEIPDDLPATAPRGGLFGRLLGRAAPEAAPRRVLDDAMLESLEELLIGADMGVDTALRVTANMAEGRMGKRLSSQEIKELLAQEIARIMDPVARPMPIYAKRPQVVLVVGVNGSGKTTTIVKLAA